MSDTDKPEKKIGFWSTLPGIISGTTALIVAVTGLITALNEVGILKLFPTWGSKGSSSKTAISKYESLKNSLAAKDWESADSLTMSILLEEVSKVRSNRKPNQNWLDPADIRTLPCSELNNINQIWAEASNNRFGFVVQSRVWESVGGTTATEPDNPNIRKKFSARVGWRDADRVPLTLERLFQVIINKPVTEISEGYLPSVIGQYQGNVVLVGNYNEFAALTEKLKQCKISK
jgi:hypothetical protein